MDSKFYAATQAMDEARHVELYARFMREKVGLYYPVNPELARLLEDSLGDELAARRAEVDEAITQGAGPA